MSDLAWFTRGSGHVGGAITLMGADSAPHLHFSEAEKCLAEASIAKAG